MIKISLFEYKEFTNYLYDISGNYFDDTKVFFIESRLGGLVKEEKCLSFFDLCHKAKADKSKSLEQKIIDRITTKETFFFRDTRPFELLKGKILPELINKRMSRYSGGLPLTVRILSAGCSTGQEVYSIAIVLKEAIPDLSRFRITLLGSDISRSAIAQAQSGKYSKLEISRGLSLPLVQKYFTCHGTLWKVKDEIRAMTFFKTANLLNQLDNSLKFDIIFCRNLALYLKLEDRKKLFENMMKILDLNGYLIIGSTESLLYISSDFEAERYMKTVFYNLCFPLIELLFYKALILMDILNNTLSIFYAQQYKCLLIIINHHL